MKKQFLLWALVAVALSSCQNEYYNLRFYVVNESSRPLLYRYADPEFSTPKSPVMSTAVLLCNDKLCVRQQMVDKQDVGQNPQIAIPTPYLTDFPLLNESDSISIGIVSGDKKYWYAITPEDKSNWCWLQNYQYDRDLDGYVFIIDDDFLEHLRTTQSEQE